MTCPACGQTNPEDARFCNHRGLSLAHAVALPASPPLPTSFFGGRDQVKRLLGEGGKKKVYLVHDTVLDRDVAFSLIKTEGLDEVGLGGSSPQVDLRPLAGWTVVSPARPRRSAAQGGVDVCRSTE